MTDDEIRKRADSFFDGPSDKRTEVLYTLCLRFAQHILATQWRPIEEAPKDGTLILVKEKRCSGLAVMYVNGWKYESGNICYLDPTHFMEIPPDPEEE